MNTHLSFSYSPAAFSTDAKPDLRRSAFRAKKMLEGLVFDAIALENNPFTFPEVKTLLEGITVGGHKLSDEQQVLNQAKAWKELISQVEKGEFSISKDNYCHLQGLVAYEEALEWGVFRDGNVVIAGTEFKPPNPELLDELFSHEIQQIDKLSNTYEKAICLFLSGARNQYFWDGNKRTSRLMMNGILLSNGLDVISVPAAKALEFNTKMVHFYDTGDGNEMIDFMARCSLDSSLRVSHRKLRCNPPSFKP